MKTIAIALGTAATALATMASAQVYYQPQARAVDFNSECYNPRAGQFEQVRPGEYQDDLDMSRCRVIGGERYANRYDSRYDNNRYEYDTNRYENRVQRDSREECWNHRARTFEQVRPGERQDDLDYGRCRLIAGERYYRYR